MPVALDTPIRTNAQSLEKILGLGKPTLLVFEKPGSQTCAALDPTLRDLALRYSGEVLIVQVDDATEADLDTRFNLDEVPTLIAWSAGGEKARIEGAVSTDIAAAYVDYLLGRGPRPSAKPGPTEMIVERTATRPAPQPAARPPTAGNGNHPIATSDATFEQDVLRSPVPVLVDFWAPWCGPCRMVAPILEEISRDYSGRLVVAKLNTDENPRRPGSLDIRGIPTMILFKNGREVDRLVGAAPKPRIQQFVEKNL